MFKVGDKVKTNDSDLTREVVYIHKRDHRVHYMVAYKGDVPVGFFEDKLMLVESAPETKKEEVKMLKVEVKETIKEVVQKFPCIRKGTLTGLLYLFHDPAQWGRSLSVNPSTWVPAEAQWSSTEPFTGTVTLTQE